MDSTAQKALRESSETTAGMSAVVATLEGMGKGAEDWKRRDSDVIVKEHPSVAMAELAAKISKGAEELYNKRSRTVADKGKTPSLKLGLHTSTHGGLDPEASSSEEGEREPEMERQRAKHQEQLQNSKDEDSEGSDYEYDFNVAAGRLGTMMDLLRNEKRTEIMTQLNNFYANRSGTVEGELEDLDQREREFLERVEDTKDSLLHMQKALESKGSREVSVLIRMSNTLTAGSKGQLKRRQKFSKAAKEAEADEAGGGDDGVYRKPKDLKPLVIVPGEDAEDKQEQPDTQNLEIDAETAATADLTKEAAWDVDEARKIWNQMNEKAAKISNSRAAATDILQAMALVQTGNADLEQRADLAKRAVALLSQSVEYLARTDINAQKAADPAVVEYTAKLRQYLLNTVDFHSTEEGPDPEELEEECQELEKLIADQDKLMALYRKHRDRSRLNEKEAAEDESLDDTKNSRVVDARLEGILQKAEPSVQSKFKAAASMAQSIAKLGKKEKDTAQPLAQSESMLKRTRTVASGDFEDDPKVIMLREHISTKDAEIRKAHALFQRMRLERRLLRYCQRKAKRGFDDISKEFKPPTMDDMDAPSEASDDDEAMPKEGGQGTDVSTLDNNVADGGSAKSRSKMQAPKKGSSLPLEPPRLVQDIRDAEESGADDIRKAEENLDREINDMNKAIHENSEQLKDERMKQKTMRKDVKDLKKEFAIMTSSDRNAPTTLQGLKEAIEAEEDTEKRIREQIEELTEELQTQQNILNIAQAQQRMGLTSRASLAVSQPPQTVPQTASMLGLQATPQTANVPTMPAALQTASALAMQVTPQMASAPNMQATPETTSAPTSQTTPPTASAPAMQASPQTATVPAMQITPPTASAPTIQATSQTVRLPLMQATPPTASVPAMQASPHVKSMPATQAEVPQPASEAVPPAAAALQPCPAILRARFADEATSQLSPATPQAGSQTSPAALRTHIADEATSQLSPSTPQTTSKPSPTATRARFADEATSQPSPATPQTTSQPSPAAPRARFAGETDLKEVGAEAGDAAARPSVVSRLQGAVNKVAMTNMATKGLKGHKKETPESEADRTSQQLIEMVRIQTKTEELRKEINDIEGKMKQLKALMKKKGTTSLTDTVKGIMGVSDAEEVKPPPEFFQLKREVKLQQAKIKDFRKKWWQDHKDFDFVVEKVRQQVVDRLRADQPGNSFDHPQLDDSWDAQVPARDRNRQSEADTTKRAAMQSGVMLEGGAQAFGGAFRAQRKMSALKMSPSNPRSRFQSVKDGLAGLTL
eukprot:TRINITY_DN76219_c0_g1_i1.p1 TRINITY_DN76219_c0_g1~~TRINITY_DN76219_c0_g1_i1.p1  ORF type:complete len:1284 (-),score=341.43 TRINITY_DN76219_c0_g1_i1:333-4184(-)